MAIVGQIADKLAPSGIHVRGIVAFEAEEGPLLASGLHAASVLLLGNIGGSVWPAFSRWREGYCGPDPLDTWSKQMIRPVAADFGATAYFPSDQPYQPFQRWAMQAEPLAPSALGILIHPRYGLWHGYRGALGFPTTLDPIPAEQDGASTPPQWMEECAAACPVAAVGSDGFDVAACRRYIASQAGQRTCMLDGCAVRNCYPVGAEYRYPAEQVRFHMDALF